MADRRIHESTRPEHRRTADRYPRGARTRQDVYGFVAGDIAFPRPRAARIAEFIEDDLMRRGWPVGSVVGPEKSLAMAYGVGTAVIRQSLRLLEARGVGQVRRGPSGGLVVSQPSRSRLVRILAQHFRWAGLRAEDIAEASNLILSGGRKRPAQRSAIGRVTDIRDNSAGALALDVLREFNVADCKLPGLQYLDFEGDQQATQLVRILMKEVTRQRCMTEDYLGSIPELSERYGADPRLVVQAARLAADLGMVRIQRGRAGGLFLRSPGCDAVACLIYSQMVALDLDQEDAQRFLWHLNIIHARKAAENGGSERLRLAEDALISAPLDEVPYFWIRLQQEIAYAAVLPALHMFSRCFAGFTIRASSVRQMKQGTASIDVRNISRAVVEAIFRQDPDAAEEAQATCHCLIDAEAMSTTTRTRSIQ